MSRDGVQPHAQNRSSDEVNYWLPPPEITDNCIRCELNHCVLDFQGAQWFWIDHQRSYGVEEGLEEEPEHLPSRGAEEPSLKVRRDVHIQLVSAQVPVVVDVVLLEGGGVGHADGQVGPHGEPAVPLGPLVPKGHVVGDVVNGQSQGVVDAASEGVGPEEDPLPGEIVDQVAGKKLG